MKISNFQFPISNNPKKKYNTGQIVLILVLMTIVGATIGLSLISRTIQDVRISSQVEQSSRAFSAAEAGIENALKSSSIGSYTGSVSVGNTTSNYEYTVEDIGGGGSSSIIFGLTGINQSRTLWLVGHTEEGELIETAYYATPQPITICWTHPPGDVPALVVSLYYKDGSNYYVIKGAYDREITRGNNFRTANAASVAACGAGYNYQITVSPSTSNPDFPLASATSIPLFLRIQTVYAGTSFIARSSSAFPSQGKQITSVGQTSTGITRKIQVIQGFKTVSSLLDFTLYNQ